MLFEQIALIITDIIIIIYIIDLCTDDMVRQWLVDMKTTQDARKTSAAIPSVITAVDPGHSNGASDFLSPTGITRR